jgi:hypothetical protein
MLGGGVGVMVIVAVSVVRTVARAVVMAVAVVVVVVRVVARALSMHGVGTFQNGYIRNVPLPRVVPRIQSASHVTSHGADPDTCYSQVPRVPTCSNLNRLLQGLGGKGPLPLFPCWLM